ncbi:hypothetical protein [Halalkalibacter alkaliphilus]|uniref:Lipoprotein n=1 Tax=Halalkalibacter alkaliphilus TaxID=2917993 RepID=A0A9X2I4Y0_9BACI|nr:hypothetical protein [Halalkalibacter alkaliphilus]MCL7748311.1 hypothetical protein [Halalkalibacter alkaliphilus]
MKNYRNGCTFLITMLITVSFTTGCGYFKVSQLEQISPVGDFSTSEEVIGERDLVSEQKITIDHSILELDQELLFVSSSFRDTFDQSFFNGLTPFQVFQLYMYTLAGEDYETLYYFYNSESMQISKEQFITEGRNDVNSAYTRDFMKKFNEVRKFDVWTKQDSAGVQFVLEAEHEQFTFQLFREGNMWLVSPNPLQ